MSGPMQLRQDGTWVPALTSGHSPVTVPDDAFGGLLQGVSPPPGRPHIEQLSPARPPPKPAPVKPKNVVAMAKARLAEVRKELRRMKSLEKERDELERLIKAAETKPKAVVTALKTAVKA